MGRMAEDWGYGTKPTLDVLIFSMYLKMLFIWRPDMVDTWPALSSERERRGILMYRHCVPAVARSIFVVTIVMNEMYSFPFASD